MARRRKAQAAPAESPGAASLGAAGEGRIVPWLQSTRLQLVLYSLLLVGTPFLMLRAYMQDAIGHLSAAQLELGGVEVPWVLVLLAGALVPALALLRRHLTLRHGAAALVALAMVAAAQQITDYYYGHAFYELQFNWHYIAYLIFALLALRDFGRTRLSLEKRLLLTVGLALCFSTFDEAFQLAINSRVFDAGDIAKDVWGAVTGCTVCLVAQPPAELHEGRWRRLAAPDAAAWRLGPAGVLLWLVLTAAGFVFHGSLLSDPQYVGNVALLTAAGGLLAYGGLLLLRRRWGRRGLLLAGLLAGLVLGGSHLRQRGDGVTLAQAGLTVYSGLPLPVYDLLVAPAGWARPVDKKHYFNARDIAFLYRRFRPDILLVGAGYDGKGGAGFPHRWGSGFVYNHFSQQVTQVIILDSSSAVALHQRLRAQGKNVLFVLHST